MNKTLKIAFLGGDRRQHTAAVKLAGGRYEIYGFMIDGECGAGIIAADTLEGASVSVGGTRVPVPFPLASGEYAEFAGGFRPVPRLYKVIRTFRSSFDCVTLIMEEVVRS